MIARTVLAAALLAFSPVFGSAQTVTDVAQQVANAMSSQPPVPVTVVSEVFDHNVGVGGGHDGGTHVTPVYRQVVTTTQHKLVANNIRAAVVAPITFDQPQPPKELPDHMLADAGIANNCSSIPTQYSFSLSKAFQQSASVTLTNTVAHAIGGQVGFSDKITDALGVSGSISTTTTTTVATARATGEQTTITQADTVTVSVPPQHAIVEQLEEWPEEYVLPFKTTVTVEADLSPPNDRGLVLLSQILPESARTFEISGTVTADTASKARVVSFDTVYDPTACTTPNARRAALADNTPQQARPFVPKKSQKLIERQQ